MAVYINDDFCCFWTTGFDNMNKDGLRRQIDYYAEKGGVTAILFNMNASRAFFDSKVWDPVWKDCSEEDEQGRIFFHGREVTDISPEPPMKTMVRNAREMSRNVPDIFGFRYRYCHEKGVEMWHSMRMNDDHWAPNPELPQHSSFWYEHPEFRRAAYRKPLSSIWSDQALDYLHPEVREHIFALIAEYLSHECDGIELDFLRDIYLFRPGGAEQGRPLLTQMMRDIRAEADKAEKKFGHRVKIMVRVPAEPYDTLLNGLDFLTWAKEGLIDIVSPSSNRLDVPYTIWRTLLPSNIELSADLEIGIRNGYPGGAMKSTRETDTGFAATFYYRGADSIHFFNHFSAPGCGYVKQDLQKEVFSYIGDRAKTEARQRRHVATAQERTLPGYGSGSLHSFYPLAWKGSGIYNEIDVGGGTDGRNGYVIIGSNTEIKNAEVKLNTVTCTKAELPSDWDFPKLNCFVCFRVPDNVLHDGLNGIDVINRSLEEDFELRWVELDVL